MYIQKEKGITLIALIVTIIIILILATVGGYSANKVYENAEKDAFIKRMQLIAVRLEDEHVLTGAFFTIYYDEPEKPRINLVPEEICEELLSDKENVKFNYKKDTTNYELYVEREQIGVPYIVMHSPWKLYTPKMLKEYLNIEDVDDYVVVNMDTKEVISLTGITYNGKKYYTQYSLPGGGARPIEATKEDKNIEYKIETTNNGLNCIVKINPKKNGQDYSNNMRFKYKRMTEWPNVGRITPGYYDSYNAEWIDMNRDTIQITQSGYYIFMGIDRDGDPNYPYNNPKTGWRFYYENEDYNTPVEIILANPPKLYETTNEIELVNNIAESNSDIETTNLENWRYNYAHLSDRSVWNPILSNNSAGIREENKIYFWMPRFAYKYDYDTGIINIVTLKGNSNISTWDDKELTIGNEENDWKIPEVFYNPDNPNEQYRGVWIEKKAKSYELYKEYDSEIENYVTKENESYMGTEDFYVEDGIINNGLINYNNRNIEEKHKIDIKPVI